MCLAIPSKVVAINDKMATIDVSGVRRDISLLLLPEEPAVGDFVLVHAGFAIQKIDREAAEEALKLIEEIEEIEGSTD
jgi:hydrogenase expression/formation protein HypC